MSTPIATERQKIVELAALDDMLSSLHRLKSYGGFSRSLDDEFWFTSTSSIEYHAPADEDLAVAQYRDYGEKMKALHTDCIALLQTTRDEFVRLSLKMVPILRRRGFASLPDDLLAEIFEWSKCDPLDLRMVSRGFHRIVMSLPRLWSTIPHYTPVNRLQLSLKYSFGQSLDVRLRFGDNPDRTIRRMEMIMPHANRIAHLEVDFSEEHSDILNKTLHGLDLSRLQSLTVDLFSRSEDAYGNTSQCTFYDGWYTPKLTTFDSSNNIPKPIRGMSLRECSMKLNYLWTIWNMSHLSAFFAASPALEHLTVHFEDFSPTVGTFEPVVLRRLKSLDVTISVTYEYSFTDIPWRDIFKGLVDEAPNLEEMQLTTFIEDCDEFARWFNMTFSRPRRYQSLHTLGISIKRTVSSPSWFLHDLFQSVPNLRHLTLESFGLDLTANVLNHVRPIPLLESICFRHCFRCDEMFFDDTLSALERRWSSECKDKSGSYPHVTVTFVGCSTLRRKEVEECWGRHYNVVWYDADID